jgi:hypothetical protein
MPTEAKGRKRVTVESLAVSVESVAMSVDNLAGMVQEGFLDMGNRITRVEGRLTSVEVAVSGLQQEMKEVKAALPTFVPMTMHEQLKKRVAVVEEKVGV